MISFSALINKVIRKPTQRCGYSTSADALVVCAAWNAFRHLIFEVVKAQLKQLVIIDGRNLYELEMAKANGIVYYGIGRGWSFVA
jgi:hypothetical protein